MIINTNLDYFLRGMAIANHSAYLEEVWHAEDIGIAQRCLVYGAGILERAIYIVFKVITATVFIFINIALSIHYFISHCQNVEAHVRTQRKIRLFIGLLVLGESIPGIGIDAIGLVCPPAAYRIHSFFRETITRQCFDRWGIDDYGKDFVALNYFIKLAQ